MRAKQRDVLELIYGTLGKDQLTNIHVHSFDLSPSTSGPLARGRAAALMTRPSSKSFGCLATMAVEGVNSPLEPSKAYRSFKGS